MLEFILQSYDLDKHTTQVVPLSTGLINQTWKVVEGNGKEYILQRINTHVFKEPLLLSENLEQIGYHVQEHHPEYRLVVPIKNNLQETLTISPHGDYFRMSPFVSKSITIDRVARADQAYEAALQFGRFVNVLSDFDTTKLHTIIQDFHNLSWRYRQFDNATKRGDAQRIRYATDLIQRLKAYSFLVADFEAMTQSKDFVKRVMHHDTKISNVLFDESGRGICVIDLDTVMGGYYISDVGDMLRTYISPTTEEELNFDLIEIRTDVFEGIVGGYMEAMANKLTPREKNYFIKAGFFLTYMQALRFLTDFLNRDIYYSATREFHNFNRAKNQLTLLQRIEERQTELKDILRHHI